ncbi:MAG: YegP family protein [Defluviicoccus sp.]|nr:YegP family protein [Defluviicoccus sp.]
MNCSRKPYFTLAMVDHGYVFTLFASDGKQLATSTGNPSREAAEEAMELVRRAAPIARFDAKFPIEDARTVSGLVPPSVHLRFEGGGYP